MNVPFPAPSHSAPSHKKPLKAGKAGHDACRARSGNEAAWPPFLQESRKAGTSMAQALICRKPASTEAIARLQA